MESFLDEGYILDKKIGVGQVCQGSFMYPFARAYFCSPELFCVLYVVYMEGAAMTGLWGCAADMCCRCPPPPSPKPACRGTMPPSLFTACSHFHTTCSHFHPPCSHFFNLQPKRIENARILVANTAMDTDKIKIYGARVRVDAMSKVCALIIL